MKILLPGMLILCFPFLLKAQDNPSRPCELGVEVTQLFSVFNSSGSATGSFIFRRLYKKGAFRSRLAVSFGVNERENNTPQRINGSSNYNLSGAIGYEKHIPVIKNWSIFWGGELGLHYVADNDERDNGGQNFFTGNKRRSKGASISPLMGVRFKLNERISLATESRFSITYQLISRETITSDGTTSQVNETNEFYLSGRFRTPYSLYLLIRL